MNVGCDRCLSYFRGFYLQKPEVFRTERTFDMNGTLKQCRGCATWWVEWPGSHWHIIAEHEATDLIRQYRPPREASSFGEIDG